MNNARNEVRGLSADNIAPGCSGISGGENTPMNLLYPTTYVVWDLETTGLYPDKDRIVEFAALIVKNGRVAERKSFILNHGIDIPEEATRVHGITKQKCKKEGVKPKVALEWALWTLNIYPASVTHNGLCFDIPFLLAEAFRLGLLADEAYQEYEAYLYDTCIDTAVLYKAMKIKLARYWNEPFAEYGKRVLEVRAKGVKYNVGFCCDELKINRFYIQQHRAGGDVELTNEIYKKITTRDYSLGA
jgi:DNA polymerase III epsilon subunit-like protein